MRIDLHVHSTASDGSLTPGSLVAAARAGGLDILAIADHDTVAGVRVAQDAAAGSIHVIPALEISTRHAGAELHLLGYYVDPLRPSLVQYGERASSARTERMREMLELLAGLGIRIGYDEVLRAAGTRPESIGRPHLARALLDRGAVRTIGEAFDRLIGDDGPAFVPTKLITPAEAIEIVHGAGGVAVWAHPRPDLLDAGLPALVDWGLDGLECYRPRVGPADADRITAVAARHRLFLTGGSDWHGEWQGPLGGFAVERDDVSEFLEIGGI